MSILQLRDPNTGKFIPIPALVGPQGPAPVRGVDYWTPVDQESIVQDVLRALGTPVFGRIDINNNIILTGELAEGVYTLWYEDKNGKTTKLCTYDITPAYTNWLKRSTEADGTPYNGGQGWKTDTRLNSSGVETTSDAAGIEVTGFIPIKYGEVIRFKNITIPVMGADDYAYSAQTYFTIYDADKNVLVSKNLGYLYLGSTNTQGYGLTLDGPKGNIIEMRTSELYNPGFPEIDWRNENMAFFRISCEEISDDSIITINQEIPSEDDDSGTIAIEWSAGVKLDKDTGVEGSGGNYAASQSFAYDSRYSYTLATSDSYLVQAAICWYGSDGSYLGWNDALTAGVSGEAEMAVLVPLDNAASFRIRAYTIYSTDTDGLRTKTLNTISFRKDLISDTSYTNMIPLSTEVDGVTLYNGGKGYKENTRWSASGGGDVYASGVYTCGYIPVSYGDVIRIKNIRMNRRDYETGLENACTVPVFTELGTGSAVNGTDLTSYWSAIWDEDNLVQFTINNESCKYIRLNTAYIGPDSILTINQEII